MCPEQQVFLSLYLSLRGAVWRLDWVLRGSPQYRVRGSHQYRVRGSGVIQLEIEDWLSVLSELIRCEQGSRTSEVQRVLGGTNLQTLTTWSEGVKPQPRDYWNAAVRDQHLCQWDRMKWFNGSEQGEPSGIQDACFWTSVACSPSWYT